MVIPAGAVDGRDVACPHFTEVDGSTHNQTSINQNHPSITMEINSKVNAALNILHRTPVQDTEEVRLSVTVLARRNGMKLYHDDDDSIHSVIGTHSPIQFN